MEVLHDPGPLDDPEAVEKGAGVRSRHEGCEGGARWWSGYNIEPLQSCHSSKRCNKMPKPNCDRLEVGTVHPIHGRRALTLLGAAEGAAAKGDVSVLDIIVE